MAGTSNSLILPQTIGVAHAAATAANTAYSGTPTAVSLLVAGANGTLIRKLSATARATVTATQLQIFDYDGTTYWYHPVSPLMSAYTMAQTTANGSITDFGFGDQAATSSLNGTIYLPSGHTLYAAIGVALSAGIVFRVEYSNF